MPSEWDEFTTDELRQVLAESRGQVEGILALAHDLEVKLPETRAAFRDGILRESKAAIIAAATQVLDPAEARAAEAMVLDRAGRLTPAGLRAAIARAVMEVAPEKARKRREQAARDARVQRWAEDSGNAALMGRELPPAEVLAADQRITAWARQLRQAGLDGSMDELRARAYLDLLLGKDSRPSQPAAQGAEEQDGPADGDGNGPDGTGDGDGNGPDGTGDGDGNGPDGTGDGDGNGPDGTGDGDGNGPDGTGGPTTPTTPPPGGSLAGMVPAGFVGRVTLTVPLATVTGLADRPGEMAGIGPIDPWLARDLTRAAADNPQSTWCVTVTDEQGHAVGHGCARPEPKSYRKRDKPGPPCGPGPPGGTGNRDGPGFTLTVTNQHGPPGGYGTWRLTTGGGGQQDLIVALDPIATGDCDHRFEAKGHDPGVKLRHLTQIRHATCTGPGCRRPSIQWTSSTTSRTRRAAGRACVMPDRSADMTIGSNNTHAGRSSSSPTPRSGGPPRRGGSTSPSRRGTRSNRPSGHRSRTRSPDGWEQQIRTLPAAGSSIGSGA
jgi:Domain of unknown function (DUF222)